MSSIPVNPRVVPPRFDKDPDEIISYGFDWGPWLNSVDTIVTSTWIVPTDITSTGSTHDLTTTYTLLGGGTVGRSYTCVNRITTANGQTSDRSLVLVIMQK